MGIGPVPASRKLADGLCEAARAAGVTFSADTVGGTAWNCAGISIPVALVLALLGPGGYSVDARLFGRRSVVINDPSEPPERKH